MKAINSFIPQKITLRGTPKEVGYQHGETLRTEINTLFNERFSIISSLAGVSTNDISTTCCEILHQTKKFLPTVFDEIVATAESANLEAWELVVAGGYSDVLDRVGKLNCFSSSINECSLISIVLTDNTPLLIGTWDTHASAQRSLVIVDRQIVGKPNTLALSTAGWPIQQGVNEFGLAFAIANMGAKPLISGTSYICALAAIASTKSSKEAVQKATHISLCSARYYKFLDTTGKALGIESTGNEFFELSGYKAHTNHFVSKKGEELEGRLMVRRESEARRVELENIFRIPCNSVEDVFSRLKLTDKVDSLIVKHGNDIEDRTCATFVISPVEKAIWFTAGPPSCHEIQKVLINPNNYP